MNIVCPICKRNVPDVYQEEHHLIPRGICKRNKYAKMPQLNKANSTITLCIDCGNILHKLFLPQELAETYNTIEKILTNEDIKTWGNWASRKKDFNICMKSKKKR